MAYTPTIWKNGQAPALNAENLNKMEQGIAGAQNPYTAEQLLSDTTRGVLGLGSNTTPDDAFLVLAIGTGTYGYRVKIQLADGMPVEGATVSGITALTGSTLVSGADGIVLGKSTSQTVTIGCTSPYIDQTAPANQSVTATGTITDVTLTLTPITDMITVTSSKTVKVSPMAKTMDATAVGGGGGGGNGGGDFGGGGGGGGYIVSKLRISEIANAEISVEIGSGGKNTNYNGTSGGITTVKNNSTGAILASAAGGNGGGGNGTSSAPSGGTGGSKGGDGGRIYGNGYPADFTGKAGADATGYIFDDTSLGLAGGGGGGGAGSNRTSTGIGAGGKPYGGAGGLYGSSGATTNATGGQFGGGGGGGYSNDYGAGGSGIVYFRFHF